MSSPLAISSDTAGGPIFPLLLTVFTVSKLHTVLICVRLKCFQSIFQVFLLCLAGYILAWRGILDKRTIKVCWRSRTIAGAESPDISKLIGSILHYSHRVYSSQRWRYF
jgi:hypothetical protein